MKHLKKFQARKESLNISAEQIATITKLSLEEVQNFFDHRDISIKNLEEISKLFGLDIDGNEIRDIQTLKENRAKEKAIYIMSLVQDTSALEGQGLDKEQLDELIEKTKQELLTGEYKDKLWAT